jgi:hypothetical protein
LGTRFFFKQSPLSLILLNRALPVRRMYRRHRVYFVHGNRDFSRASERRMYILLCTPPSSRQQPRLRDPWHRGLQDQRQQRVHTRKRRARAKAAAQLCARGTVSRGLDPLRVQHRHRTAEMRRRPGDVCTPTRYFRTTHSCSTALLIVFRYSSAFPRGRYPPGGWWRSTEGR